MTSHGLSFLCLLRLIRTHYIELARELVVPKFRL
jgi:hypothetical protein